mgnify:CR=1 FL=1|jgi:hypothetical protein
MVNYSRTVVLPALISGLILAPPLTAQVAYSESFRSPTMPGTDGVTPCNTGAGGPGTYEFPVGWLLRNVDNGVPAANVSYINEAWEVREDFGGGDNNNCVAFSTSWYVPSGTANDFMWSPQIAVPAGGANLSWRAKAYDPAYLDGYEVRVMPAAGGPPSGGTGVIGNQLSNSTVVFSTGGEQSTWITRNVDLTSFAGQNVTSDFATPASTSSFSSSTMSMWRERHRTLPLNRPRRSCPTPMFPPHWSTPPCSVSQAQTWAHPSSLRLSLARS